MIFCCITCYAAETKIASFVRSMSNASIEKGARVPKLKETIDESCVLGRKAQCIWVLLAASCYYKQSTAFSHVLALGAETNRLCHQNKISKSPFANTGVHICSDTTENQHLHDGCISGDISDFLWLID